MGCGMMAAEMADWASGRALGPFSFLMNHMIGLDGWMFGWLVCWLVWDGWMDGCMDGWLT
jgi:membrane associated rhomboid family serine protease